MSAPDRRARWLGPIRVSGDAGTRPPPWEQLKRLLYAHYELGWGDVPPDALPCASASEAITDDGATVSVRVETWPGEGTSVHVSLTSTAGPTEELGQ